MEIKTIRTGFLEENCYLLIQDDSCLIIDPGADFFKIQEAIGKLKPIAILITHGHFDHVGALNELEGTYHIPVYSFENLKEKITNIGDFAFETIYTPGHSSDSISFFFENDNMIFVGDFIFKNSVGRWDLETGNKDSMEESLNKFMERFDGNPNLVIYSGHGEPTTYRIEKENNPFFNK